MGQAGKSPGRSIRKEGQGAQRAGLEARQGGHRVQDQGGQLPQERRPGVGMPRLLCPRHRGAQQQLGMPMQTEISTVCTLLELGAGW